MLRHHLNRLAVGALLTIPIQLQSQRSRVPERLIDMHFHVWDSVPAAGVKRRALLAAFDRYRVRMVVASGPVSLMLQLRQLAPERFVVGPAFTEAITLPPVDTLATDLRTGRLGVLGEIDAQYAGVSLDAPLLEPYWAMAAALNVPVAVHTGFGQPRTPFDPCCPKYRTRFGNPQDLEEALARHPELRVYLMHAGWPYLAETKAIMHMYPQVYADLSTFALNPGIPREEFYDYLRALLRAGFGKRLMFGSGLSPNDWAEHIGSAIALIDDAPFLTQSQKADIFYNNAARFLYLELPRPGRP